ncbi:hypothetical protein J1605_001988, partial [Eschrichtius robustus]
FPSLCGAAARYFETGAEDTSSVALAIRRAVQGSESGQSRCGGGPTGPHHTHETPRFQRREYQGQERALGGLLGEVPWRVRGVETGEVAFGTRATCQERGVRRGARSLSEYGACSEGPPSAPRGTEAALSLGRLTPRSVELPSGRR